MKALAMGYSCPMLLYLIIGTTNFYSLYCGCSVECPMDEWFSGVAEERS